MITQRAGTRSPILALLLLLLPWYGFAAEIGPSTEPQIFSIFPLGGQPGTKFRATIRGQSLLETSAFWFDSEGLMAEIQKHRKRYRRWLAFHACSGIEANRWYLLPKGRHRDEWTS